MKKQNLKLGLNKINVSNLSSIRGGGNQPGPATTSCTCPWITDPDYTDACVETWETTCHGGTSRNCTAATHCLC